MRASINMHLLKYYTFICRGSADYLGLNHYTTQLVEPAPASGNTIYPNDDGLVHIYDPKWPSTAKETFKVRKM